MEWPAHLLLEGGGVGGGGGVSKSLKNTRYIHGSTYILQGNIFKSIK